MLCLAAFFSSFYKTETIMKLQCQVEVVNRQHALHAAINIRSGKYLKSTLALGKEPRGEKDYFIIHFSTTNKSGTKYRVKSIKQVFVRCLNDGKATIRLAEPPHDLCIRCEVIQLKCFLKLLKACVTGEAKDLQLLSNLSVIAKDNAPTKMVICDRSQFPARGLPRTLEYLSINGLKLYNFRRDILLLRNLVVLDLSKNAIEKIPSEFGRMPRLSELYLSHNKLGGQENSDWKWLLGPEIVKTLKLLDLTGNEIVSLPKALWKLQKLVTLKLDINLIQKLPASLGRITSLRYLGISQNMLTSLPCSLMKCQLESIDLSTNMFHTTTGEQPSGHHTPWEFYIGSLGHLASKVILKHKQYYAPNIIPWTLVEFLDNANVCVCGNPVVNNTFYVNREFVLKDFFRVVVFDTNESTVNFECFFCSPKCYSKFK